jgi:hypothetical protein
MMKMAVSPTAVPKNRLACRGCIRLALNFVTISKGMRREIATALWQHIGRYILAKPRPMAMVSLVLRGQIIIKIVLIP